MYIPGAQLTTTQWLNLPVEVRAKLKEVFHIPRSEGTSILDGKVTSDGYTHRDLAVITIGRLRAYIGTPDVHNGEPDADFDFVELFNKMLDKIEPEVFPVVAIPEPVKQPDTISVLVNGERYVATKVDSRLGMVKATDKNTPAGQPLVAPVKNKGGRPKGSKNKAKAK